MIVCEECGYENEPGARFCGNCSAYLDWDQGSAQPEPPSADARSFDDVVLGAPSQLGEDAHAPAVTTAPGEPEPEPESEPEPEPESEPEPAPEPAPEPESEPESEPGPAPEPEPVPAREAAPQPQPEPAPAPTPPPTPEPEPTAGSAPELPHTGPVVQAAQPAGENGPADTQAPVRTTAARPVAPSPTAPKGASRQEIQTAAEEARRRAAAAALLKPVTPGSHAGLGVVAPPTGTEAPSATLPGMGAMPAAAGGTSRQPQARKPGEAEQRRTPPPKPDDEPEAQPGDLICGNCGAGNVPTRKFCRRCGASLEQAVTMAALPWYRRIFRRTPAQPKVAGTRPQKTHSDSQRRAARIRRVFALLVSLGVLAAAVWFLRPYAGGVVDMVKDRVVEQVQVTPVGAEASSSTKGHRAAETRDGFKNTFWEPREPGQASGEELEYTFDDPFRLVTVLMIPGASDDQAEFLKHGRPGDVRVSVTTADGEEVEKTWELPDQPGQQSLSVGVDDVVSVRLTIAGSYGADEGRRVAIAEVEFWTRP